MTGAGEKSLFTQLYLKEKRDHFTCSISNYIFFFFLCVQSKQHDLTAICSIHHQENEQRHRSHCEPLLEISSTIKLDCSSNHFNLQLDKVEGAPISLLLHCTHACIRQRGRERATYYTFCFWMRKKTALTAKRSCCFFFPPLTMTSESCKTAGTAHSHREGSRDKSCWNTSSMPTRCRHSSHRLRSEGEKRCRDSHHAGSGVAEVSARFILQVTDNNAKVKRGGERCCPPTKVSPLRRGDEFISTGLSPASRSATHCALRRESRLS